MNYGSLTFFYNIAKREYITVNKKDHPKANIRGHVLLHVLVAEEKLGRHLKDGETVHYIDGNKMNNNPDNLMVFATSADHTMFHHGAEIYQDGDVWRAIKLMVMCPVCKKYFIQINKVIKSKNIVVNYVLKKQNVKQLKRIK